MGIHVAQTIGSGRVQKCRYTGIELKLRPVIRLVLSNDPNAVCPATGQLRLNKQPQKLSMSASNWTNRRNKRWGHINTTLLGGGCGERKLIRA